MKYLTVMIVIVGGLFCVGCHAKIDRADFVGTFVANSGTNRDIIDIRENGTYVHTYHFDPLGTEIISTNKWTCETSERETRITFEKFIWASDFIPSNFSKDQRATPSFWDVKVEKGFWKVKLRIDPDVNQFYVKQTW